MARNDTSLGLTNYVVTPSQYTAGSENVLFAPLATNVNPQFPSPLFPLSTTTNPVAVFITPSPDIAGAVYDGHPFEIKFAAKFTTTGTCSILLNLYQVTNAILTSGITSTTYATLTQATPSTGSGITKLVTGTSTAANTTSGTIIYSGQYIWDSVSKTLGIANAGTTYQKGVSISTSQPGAVVTGLNQNDLNFIPSFTFATTVPSVFNITEFVINRI